MTVVLQIPYNLIYVETCLLVLSIIVSFFNFFFLYFLNDTQIIMFYMLKKLLFGSRKKI